MSALTPRAPIRRTLRKLRPLGFVVIGLAVLALVVGTFDVVYTNLLWFDAIHYSSVYGRQLATEVVMFAVFGGATAIGVGAATWYAARLLPSNAGAPVSWLRGRWLRLSRPVRRLVLVAIPVVATLRAGFAAAGNWQLWLLWRNGTTFGRQDPRFHRDYGYYVFDLPFHHYVDSVLVSIVATALGVLIVVGYLQGAWRVRGPRPKLTERFCRAVAVVLAVLALVKAYAYWLDRFATVTSSRGPVTGQSWTDLHVVLPDKLVLLGISLALVVWFVVTAWWAALRAALVGVGVMILAGVVLGGVVPALFQTFRVMPSALSAESTSIVRNIQATRYGFGLEAVQTSSAPDTPSGPTRVAVDRAVQPRLIDPNVVSPTFANRQQFSSYYRFRRTLDVDRYRIHGKTTDVVIGVRELRQSGITLQTWTNQHLVYTHGIGVVAATTSTPGRGGLPNFVEQGIPATGALGRSFQDRIYFGQSSPSYSVVGAPPGQGHEFDQPGEARADYSYTGGGGVPIDSIWHRLLYALRFGDKNLLFASDLNPDSQLLYQRNPITRVQAVAPWLDLDGDAYPVVAGGRITWVLDGYTTTSQLPDSQEVNFRSAATTTYVKNGSFNPQPSAPVNYIRNSVVATVDAYTGAVHLYQKPGNGPDPILQAWMKAFPGLVQPASAIPRYLVPHLRYPQDLFNLQRSVLARYHVTNPADFYAGSQFWRVPTDPTVSGSVAQPSYYATMRIDGASHFGLTTPLLSLNRNNIAAYLTVDCDVNSPGYGQLQLQTVPSQAGTESPTQIRNDIESDPTIAQELTLLRTGAATVKLGNLQTLMVGGQVLAIEPIYAQAKVGRTYPLLKAVAVVYGSRPPGFAPTFGEALSQALGAAPRQATTATLAAEATHDLALLESAQAAGDSAAAAKAQADLQQVITQLASRGK